MGHKITNYENIIKEIERIGEVLNLTYDTRYLNDLSDDIQKLFMSISSENIKLNKGNTTLMQLIINKYNQIYIENDIKYVGGPLSLSKHISEENKMEIIIFGEHHSSKTDCDVLSNNQKSLLFENYLQEVLNKPSVFLDIYVELPVFSKKGRYTKDLRLLYRNNRLSNIFSKFHKCIELDTIINNKDCKLFRIHYIDIRRTDLINLYIFDSIYEEISFITDNRWNDKPNFYDKIYKLVQTFSNMSLAEFIEYTKKSIYNNILVKKELNKSYFNKYLIKYFDHVIEYECEMYYEAAYLEILNILSNNVYNESIKFDNLKDLSIILGKIIVDIYALSRIFKSFNLGYKEKYEPKIPKNIIIYAGDGHCETYRQFLKYMNFKIIEVPKRASNFCISFDGNNIFK